NYIIYNNQSNNDMWFMICENWPKTFHFSGIKGNFDLLCQFLKTPFG
ncbi:MAG: hypothetical protein RJB42_1533, partial [Bacteroidota bacterium]